ncbi:hypothetical protein PybrP1_006429 [[Pythium] brassicae (nom. inval.)]|nr:hypothetical protein PybrP1_006429 [[Pythium] brassicae (nom. inval.)]
MDLSALWSHERARLCDAHAEPSSAARSSGGAFDGPIVEETSDRQPRGLTHVSSPPLLAGAAWPQQQQQQQHPSPKRRSTVFAKRDAVFKRLVDESVLPTVSAVATVQNFFDCNEFAMEYADRAPKRFHATPSSAVSSSAAGGAGQASGGAASSVTGGPMAAASPLRKEKKATPRSTGRLQPAPSASSSNNNHSPGAPGTLGTPHASTGISSTNTSNHATAAELTATSLGAPKVSFLSRKNGRKRLEFSNARGAFRPYIGDMFGTRGEYIDGMLYMSRMKRSHELTFGDVSGAAAKGGRKLFGSAGPLQLVAALKDAVSSALTSGAADDSGSVMLGAATAAGGRVPAPGASSVSGSAVSPASFSVAHGAELGGSDDPMKQRRRCALTLSNWSSNPENAVLMVREGVVEALIVLCRANDSVTRLHCVTALMNLSHVVELRRVIVRQGAVKAIAEIVDESEDRTLRTACAISLCNLCCLEGDEEALVEDGAVSALSVLITEPSQKIESVLKMFITLTSSSGSGGGGGGAASASSSASSFTAADCDEVTAKALCNLSNFKRIRLRLMEEGVLGTIASLIRVNAPDIQEMLAYVLLNLSALKACRGEMVAKGGMGTLVALTGVTSVAAAKLLIASTLFNLSKEPGNRLRMVFEGLLLLVNELSRSSGGYAGGEALRTVCARTLYNVSCSDDTRVKLVERDGVSVLSSLSRRTSDPDAKRMCTLALCNLLGVQQAAADIMNAGAITALIQLSMTPDQPLETKRLFSKALHGLCEQRATRDAVTRAGVIPAILYLSSIGDDGETASDGQVPGTPRPETAAATIRHETAGLVSEIRARCTAALACLAADDALASHVRNAQVVRCVTRILVLERAHVGIERFCCSCLSLLCRDEACAQLMADDGAVRVVLATCVETQDLETKASCCNVLASMSCHPGCCAALVGLGAVSVLATLARIKEDAGVQRCCAVALANLSAEPRIRDVLVTAGIVGVIVLLSNTYSEESQRDCAKVLCNLSCVPGAEAQLVRDGAIGVLLMIGMVRAVHARTKATCARALFNLLNAETVKAMVHEGVVKVLPAFVALATDSSAGNGGSEVVAMLFVKLVEHPVGRNALCLERPAIKALFTLMAGASSSAARVQRLFESLLCGLVFYENSRLPSVNAGIVDALHTTTMRGRVGGSEGAATAPCSAKRLALVLFTLSKSDDTRVAVASSASIATLIVFLTRHAPTPACESAECVLYAVSTLCVLTWHSDTCSRLEHPEISRVVVGLLTSAERATTAPALPPSSAAVARPDDARDAYPARVIKTALLTLCCISQSQEMLQAMLRDGIVDALYAILRRDALQFCPVNAALARDSDFVALASTLCRQLSHTPQLSAMAGVRGSHVIPLLCTLAALVAARDPESSLDCADALCSVTFAAVKAASLVSERSADPVAALASANFVGAINALLSDVQLPETRWRCAASLWAMSFLPAYRSRLVTLGCTRILVRESYRSESGAFLSILTCCAGALCNFTLVAADAGANAAKMVAEDAVPALLQLSKLEHAEVREHCTLALTNLSGQSPKVEAGAVSALLNLSLHATTSAPGAAHVGVSPQRRLGSAATPQLSALCQPPIVCGERHKQFSTLPEFAMQIERDERVSETKYEAELAASTPPPPHLPTIPAELDDNSSSSGSARHQQGGGGAHANEDDEMRPQSTDAGDRPSCRDDSCLLGPRVALVAKSFPKVDPSESRLLGGNAGADDASDDSGDPVADDAASGSTVRSHTADGSEETRNSSNGRGDGGVAGSDPDDVGEQGETLGQLRRGGATLLLKGGSGYSLSPLARVVVRKTQATQVAKKLKDLRARRSESGESSGGFASSSPSLVLSASSTPNAPNVALSAVAPATRSSSRGLLQTATGKSGRGVELVQPSKLVGDAVTASRRRVESQANDATPLSGLDGMSTIAAAAAAARLYGVPASLSAAIAADSRSKKSADKASLKAKKKKRVVVAMKAAAAAEQQQQQPSTTYTGPASAARAKPAAVASRSVFAKYLPTPVSSDDDDDGDLCHATEHDSAAAAITEFREQAKKFGLWS